MKGSIRDLLVLLLLGAAAAVEAQFSYITNLNSTITIIDYQGPPWDVVIPNTINGLPVTSLGEESFGGFSITSVAIPSNVTNIPVIPNGALLGCSSLLAITVDPQNLVYSSTNGVLFNKSQTTLVEHPNGLGGSYRIPEGVIAIGDGAFAMCGGLSGVTIPDGVANIGMSAFAYCFGLTSVTIPRNVTNLGPYAFVNEMTGVYFKGNAPSIDSSTTFLWDNGLTAYYLPGTTGWSSPFGGIPAVLWNPRMQTGGGNFGVSNNQFGFNITGTNNYTVVVEVCTNLANPVWVPLTTNTLVNGVFYFSEPVQTNNSGRFYGLGLP